MKIENFKDQNRIDDREYVEIRLGKGKKTIFILFYPFEEEIWFDIRGLPNSAFFCAMCDGVGMKITDMGKKTERQFVPLEWAINDWGGPQDLVDALKTIKAMTLEKTQYYKGFLGKEA